MSCCTPDTRRLPQASAARGALEAARSDAEAARREAAAAGGRADAATAALKQAACEVEVRVRASSECGGCVGAWGMRGGFVGDT